MILLTGAGGQLGQDFQNLFSREGIPFIAADHRALDITDAVAVEDFLNRHDAIDTIINCAAYNDVDRAEREPEAAMTLNCEAPANLAREAGRRDLRLVTYSTDFVFDGTKQAPYREDDPARPLSVYGNSKYQGEKAVLAADGAALIIRTSWVFGVGNTNFNKAVIRWARMSDGPLRIVDDQISAPTYSRDLAEFSWRLLQSGASGLYHLTGQGQASKYEQARYLLNRLGWRGELQRAKSADFDLPAARPGYSKLDNSRAEARLGAAMPDWREAIDWFLMEMKEAGEI